MDVAHPYRAVCPTLDGDVLRTLAGTTMALTGRQVAALSGRRSHAGVLRVLNRLTEQGLVDRVELNRAAFLFTLNRDHLAYPAVVTLTGMRAALIESLKAEFATWHVPPVHASLFGSTARGDGDTKSDIDLFIVRPDEVDQEDPRWREQLSVLERKVSRWTGNRAAALDFPEGEVERLVADGRPVVAELGADAITLAGVPIATLFGDA
jgi:predicted nucleotidyltransferase